MVDHLSARFAEIRAEDGGKGALAEPTDSDWALRFAERNGMEPALAQALAEPWANDRSIRVLHALANARILTRAEVIARGYDGLSMVKNLGPKGIAFIRERLNRMSKQERPVITNHLPEFVAVPPLNDEQVERAAAAIVRWEHEHREMLDGIRLDEPIDQFKRRVDDRYRGQARAALSAVLVPVTS